MNVKIPIYERSRRFGYLFWKKEHDEKIKSLFEGLVDVNVYFMGSFVGRKRIDWKYRRIFLGCKIVKDLSSDYAYFIIDRTSIDTIHISCEKVRRRLIETNILLEDASIIGLKERYNRGKTIHTLHVWWARRPLSSMRLVTFASLAPDSQSAKEIFKNLANSIEGDRKSLVEARQLLMKEYIQPPKVLDMFSGGGTIPFESCRLGAEAYSLDINPLSAFIQKSIMEYPRSALQLMKSDRLISLLEEVGNSILKELEEETEPLFPFRNKGVICYLWTYSYKCPNCGYKFYLTKRFGISKKKNKELYLILLRNEKEETVQMGNFKTFSNWKRNSALCPKCGFEKKHPSIKECSDELVVLVKKTKGKKIFELSEKHPILDSLLEKKERELMKELELKPIRETLPFWSGIVNPALYGMETYWDIFNKRQRVVILTLIKLLKKHYAFLSSNYGTEIAKFVIAILSSLLDQLIDWNCRLSMWIPQNEQVGRAFCGPGVAMLWDYAEIDPVTSSPANLRDKLRRILSSIETIFECACNGKVFVQQGCAQNLLYPDNYFDAIVTDPPYYDNIFYSVLANFFYTWKRLLLKEVEPNLFSLPITDSELELVSSARRNPNNYHEVYVKMLNKVTREAKRTLKENGVFSLIYSHTSINGWESLIRAYRESGLHIVNVQPLNIERKHRPRGMNSTASNVCLVLVARKVAQKKRKVSYSVIEEIIEGFNFDYYKRLSWTDHDIGLAVLGKVVAVMSNASCVVTRENSQEDVIPDAKVLESVYELLKNKLPKFNLSKRKSL